MRERERDHESAHNRAAITLLDEGGGCSASGAPADPSSGATRYSKVTILSAIEPS